MQHEAILRVRNDKHCIQHWEGKIINPSHIKHSSNNRIKQHNFGTATVSITMGGSMIFICRVFSSKEISITNQSKKEFFIAEGYLFLDTSAILFCNHSATIWVVECTT